MLDSFKNFLSLLNSKEKNRLIMLIILLFFGMSMEVIGIGLLLPFLEIIANENITLKYPIFENIFSALSVENYNDQVYFFLTLIFLIYLIKSIYLIFLNYRQFSFLQRLNARISSELFKIYLNQQYLKFTSLKTSNLIKHLTSDISFFYTFSSGMLSFITEIGLLLAVMLTILFIEPAGAISIGFLFVVFSLILYFISKSKINNWGYIRNNLLEKISNISLEGFNGFKELLIFNKTDYYTSDYSQKRYMLSNIQAKMSTLSIIPRHYLEFISIIVFIVFIIYSISVGNDIKSLIPIIGVFIAASFKMIPSVNKIIVALNNIKFYSNSINILQNEFELIDHLRNNVYEVDNSYSFIDHVHFKDISFGYNEGDKTVLENINLKIKKGECIGIVGKSGAGKSTLVDIIVGVLHPNKGEIFIDSNKFENIPNSFKQELSYISQNVFLFDASIADNIKMNDLKYDENQKNQIIQAIKSADLYEMINELPMGIDTMVGENGINLSGGQKQRIAIARALYRKSKILVLDEATSNLDSITERKIINSINALHGRLTIIIVSHRKSILEKCDNIYEISGKQLKKANI